MMAAATTTPLEKFDSADLRLPSAKDEARALFGLVERGSSTAEAVRNLIEVSPADEQRLRRIAAIEPEVAHCVLPVLRFRRRVLREFERMAGLARIESTQVKTFDFRSLLGSCGSNQDVLCKIEAPSTIRNRVILPAPGGKSPMPDIDREISAYESMQENLEADHMGKWVVISDGKLVNIYTNFEDAAEDAVRRFGRGPYLIRQVGAPPVTLPASVIYG